MADLIQAAAGLPLALFIPGFALVMALYPKKKDLRLDERIALSLVLSITITTLMPLLLDLVLGINFNTFNIAAALIIFSIICCLAWLIRTRGKYE